MSHHSSRAAPNITEVLFAAAVTVVPGVRGMFGTVPPPATALALLTIFPVVIWGADDTRRWVVRRRIGDHNG